MSAILFAASIAPILWSGLGKCEKSIFSTSRAKYSRSLEKAALLAATVSSHQVLILSPVQEDRECLAGLFRRKECGPPALIESC